MREFCGPVLQYQSTNDQQELVYYLRTGVSIYSHMIDNDLMDKCKGVSWQIIRECDRLHSLVSLPLVCVDMPPAHLAHHKIPLL